MRRAWATAILLFVLTLGLYWPVRHFDLVYFDDPLLLQTSPEVKAGFTWASLKWALTSEVIANWHPVTNLSFLAVSQFFGVAPGPHHVCNAVIHALNAGLLFLLLMQLTGKWGRSVLVAGIFAWHPLRVESVAWIVERKDVLCAFFFLLSLYVYALGQTAKPAGATVPRKYLSASLLAYALALLSKPMAVTLPCVLLLLDFWPLQRFPVSGSPFPALKRVVLEKWPFFVLTVIFSVLTYLLQKHSAASTPWEVLGLGPRLQNAVTAYVAYLGQFFWPQDFAAIYPYKMTFDPVRVALCTALLAVISLAGAVEWKRRPFLATGWCWYLGMALPVIGIIQVGEQSRADRYTYLPMIGFTVALVWLAAELFTRPFLRRVVAPALAVLIVGALMLVTRTELEHWRDTIALFSRNVEVTPENGSAHFTLGLGYEHAGDTNRALVCYRVARELSPQDHQVRLNLAGLLVRTGQYAAAEEDYRQMLLIFPQDVVVRGCLADVLVRQERRAEAIEVMTGALAIDPDAVDVLNNLAWELATCPQKELRDPARAVQLARHACELTRNETVIYIGTLAAAYAAAGDFAQAVATAETACETARRHGEPERLQRNLELLERYRAGRTATDP